MTLSLATSCRMLTNSNGGSVTSVTQICPHESRPRPSHNSASHGLQKDFSDAVWKIRCELRARCQNAFGTTNEPLASSRELRRSSARPVHVSVSLLYLRPKTATQRVVVRRCSRQCGRGKSRRAPTRHVSRAIPFTAALTCSVGAATPPTPHGGQGHNCSPRLSNDSFEGSRLHYLAREAIFFVCKRRYFRSTDRYDMGAPVDTAT